MATPNYRSRFEERIADDLKERSIKFGYETTRIRYGSKINGGRCKDCNGNHVIRQRVYTPDFEFGTYGFFVEAKGYFKGTDRTKLLAVRESNPDLDLRILFLTDNKISKKSETRYSEWCEKHGFQYAFKRIPDEWFERRDKVRRRKGRTPPATAGTPDGDCEGS